MKSSPFQDFSFLCEPNDFAKNIPNSPTLAMSEKANLLAKQGHKVINLSVGEPDLWIPPWIRQAAIEAIEKGHHTYTPTPGLLELRQVIVRKLKEENDLDGYTPEEIVVSNGAKQVLFNAFMVSLQKGDEVIIPSPYWVSYPTMVEMAGGSCVMVPCDETQNFKITPQQLQQAITSRSRWFILNSPNNPTGAVYSAQELDDLAKVLMNHPQVGVISDDIYEHMTYDGNAFCSILKNHPSLKERTLIVNGMSKCFSMTGWRIGYGAGPLWLIKAMNRFQSHSTSGANCIAQYAAIAALSNPLKARDFLKQQQEIFLNRRNMMTEELSSCMGITQPQGAFYVYAQVKEVMAQKKKENDIQLAHALLEEAYVSSVPGSEFGLPGYLRFSYALGEESLLEACHRIKQWIKG